MLGDLARIDKIKATIVDEIMSAVDEMLAENGIPEGEKQTGNPAHFDPVDSPELTRK